MAKVSLRIYNREIEGLIEQGNTDEAIAHCHHILKTFSKHLATYRLLGKAYLEAKRYAETVDVFGRLLMAVPDDFVAHVGMSIINDEENKLDDAIWHMQRAFETQPSNPAIQSELQRLYGRRDGMEPPKIRMTRGALAQMYVQGELYPQAIAEIKAVLSQEPDRADMQVLLARAYFRGGQKADASDICMQLLKRYLYCFDANRIMVELLPSTAGSAESTQVYRMRVGEMDPYASFAKGSVFQIDEVADAAINLERLEYKAEEPQMGQGWGATLGLGSGAMAAPMLASSSSSDQPDWLKADAFAGTSSQTGSFSDTATESSQPAENIPDFLRHAGWGESTGPEEPTSIFDNESAAGDLAPANIPDWLKGQVPSDLSQPDSSQTASAQSIETPDWLSGLGGMEDDSGISDSAQSASAKSANANVPDWLLAASAMPLPDEPVQSGNGPDSLMDFSIPQTSEPAQPADVPDWLSGLGDANLIVPEPAQTTKSSDVPDWLAGLDDEKSSSSEQPGEITQWLSGLGDEKPSEPVAAAQPTQPADAPDWLSGLGDAEPEPAQQLGDIPDWMRGTEPQGEPAQPAASVENLGTSAQEQDDAVAWLESLAAKHGAKPEELVTDPSKRSETPPEWVSQAQNIEQQQPVAQMPVPTVESLGASAQEQDDAVAWLESLAAKHGAKPEELVTDPSKRSETPPEWVSQAQNIEQQQPVAQTPAPTVESLGASAQEQDDAVAWLESLAAKHGAKPEELVTDPSKRSETPPEWVSQVQNIEQQQPVAQTPAPTVESLGASAQEQDDAVAWLESLAAKHGAKPEELVTDPSKRFDTPPEWVSQAQSIGEAQSASTAEQPAPPTPVENAMNIGEQFFAEFENASSASSPVDETGMWLQDLEEKEKQTEPSVPAAETSDLPDWLNNVQNDSVVSDTVGNQDVSENDLSNWLSGLDDEPGLPFDAMPTPDSILFSKSQETAKPKSDLPDWLSTVDSTNEETEDAWKKSVTQEPLDQTTGEPVSETPAENLPDWLKNVDEEESAKATDDTAPWVHREVFEEKETSQPKPTASSDWHPVEAKQKPVSTPVEKKGTAPLEARQPIAPQIVPPAQPPVERSVESRAPAKKKPAVSARPRQAEGQSGLSLLQQAEAELERGDIPAALDHYKKLIKKGKHLEETIRDLTESIYRYPVEVGIWQTLGDAYMRANRLKEALEAYNKAEELIR